MKDTLRGNNLEDVSKHCENLSKQVIGVHSNMLSHTKDVVRIDDSLIIGSNSEMHPNGRNEPFVVIRVDNFSKSPSFDLTKILKNIGSKWGIT